MLLITNQPNQNRLQKILDLPFLSIRYYINTKKTISVTTNPTKLPHKSCSILCAFNFNLSHQTNGTKTRDITPINLKFNIKTIEVIETPAACKLILDLKLIKNRISI